jgi:hypothetical protein
MDYEEFHTAWHEDPEGSRDATSPLPPSETLGLRCMSRCCQVTVRLENDERSEG